MREGCLLEEEANGAHCVGLKQTILFPFVTLGSLINFCDCLMAGGTSRKDHSEVGSSYIHFNYTPDGDKTTASLFGDVPRGVMLDQPPIFLGGQGGAVGPVRVGYGTVVAAGSVLLQDVLDDGRLVAAVPPPGFQRERRPHAYRNLPRIVRNNVVYLANLVALEQWYVKVRAPFFARQDMGELVYTGALEMLAHGQGRADEAPDRDGRQGAQGRRGRPGVRERVGRRLRAVRGRPGGGRGRRPGVPQHVPGSDGRWRLRDYTEAIQGLTPDLRALGVEWLQHVVDGLCDQAAALLPAMDLFGESRRSSPVGSEEGAVRWASCSARTGSAGRPTAIPWTR